MTICPVCNLEIPEGRGHACSTVRRKAELPENPDRIRIFMKEDEERERRLRAVWAADEAGYYIEISCEPDWSGEADIWMGRVGGQGLHTRLPAALIRRLVNAILPMDGLEKAARKVKQGAIDWNHDQGWVKVCSGAFLELAERLLEIDKLREGC